MTLLRSTIVVFAMICAGCGSPQRACPPAAVTEAKPAAPVPAPAPAAPVVVPGAAGTWTGVLGGQLHLVLTLEPHPDGFTGLLDSVDQGAKLPLDHLAVTDATVHFEVAVIHGSYDGKLTGDQIVGTWTQARVPAQPLAFARGAAPPPPPSSSSPSASPAPLDAPIDVSIAQPPAPLHAGGRTTLVYELHVTNFAHATAKLTKLEVLAGGRTLATLEGDALASAIRPLGPDEPSPASLPSGRGAIVFMWLTLAEGVPLPTALEHRFTVKLGELPEVTTAGPHVAVVQTAPRVIHPPLRGARWVAANGPGALSPHRRALIPVAAVAHIGQRFAIDWVKAGDDDKTFTGDPANNASYHAYGQQALAVAGGVVTEVKDGIAENTPGSTRAVPITLETVGGNHVVVDLGGGAFALWAHLQPGSIKVKLGDHVKTGQLLGLVGNSGNSTEPHLHFQLANGTSPLASEGIPYAFDHVTISGKPVTGELPLQDAEVTFP